MDVLPKEIKQAPQVCEGNTDLRYSDHGVRLPSFSGHPISADLVSVREDVHCESTAKEIHT